MALDMFYDILSWCLIGLGCFFVLIGALGVLKLPESELHQNWRL